MNTAQPATGTPDWAASLAELNLLPSRTLHPSHYDQFDPDGTWRQLLAHAANPASVHRRWSQAILTALSLEDRITTTDASPALHIAMQTPGQLDKLAAWLGIQLCQERLRTMILQSDLRQLLAVPHADYMQQARRSPGLIEYAPASQWSAADICDRYLNLGHAALLHACDLPGGALYRRLQLKLPDAGDWPQLPAADMLLHACLEFPDT